MPEEEREIKKKIVHKLREDINAAGVLERYSEGRIWRKKSTKTKDTAKTKEKKKNICMINDMPCVSDYLFVDYKSFI